MENIEICNLKNIYFTKSNFYESFLKRRKIKLNWFNLLLIYKK